MSSAQWTDTINQETRLTVAFVTLGQTPRDDVIPEIRALVGRNMDVLEFGVLDDIPSDKLAQLGPSPGDPALLTRLRNGVDVELSMDWTSDRMNVIYSKIAASDIDLVVLMSTLLGNTPAPASATIFCDRVVARAVETFTASGLRVGLVLSLESQSELVVCGTARRESIRAAVARPGDHAALESAIVDLRDCDVIVLHSVTYSEREQQEVMQRSEKPVVLARRLVASATREALDRLAAPCSPNSHGALRVRLRTLSPREREIMFLVAEGLANKEIAFRLGISFRTVEIHRARMISKMDFRTLTDLVRTVDSLSGF